MFLFLGQPLEVQLTQQATSRLLNVFSESMRKAYATLFRSFLAFVAFMYGDLHQVTVFNLLCFWRAFTIMGLNICKWLIICQLLKPTFSSMVWMLLALRMLDLNTIKNLYNYTPHRLLNLRK